MASWTVASSAWAHGLASTGAVRLHPIETPVGPSTAESRPFRRSNRQLLTASFWKRPGSKPSRIPR